MFSHIFIVLLLCTMVAAMMKSETIATKEDLQQFLSAPEGHSHLKELHLSFKLDSDEMTQLVGKFHHLHSLKEVKFYFCGIDAERFQILSKELGKLTNLEKISIFDFPDIPVSGSAGIRELMNFLPNMPLLNYIDFYNTVLEFNREDIDIIIAAFKRRSLSNAKSVKLYFPFNFDKVAARQTILDKDASSHVRISAFEMSDSEEEEEEDGDFIESIQV